jgi:hypothetical protein
MEARFGVRMSPHEDIAIDYGAYYMSKQMRVWKLRRPQHERWRLGLAGYNAGTGNIIKAQTKCDNTRMWPEIKLCLHLVTGHHANETKTYVERIERWWTEMSRLEPWTVAPGLRKTNDEYVIGQINDKFNVRRYFNGSAWCTYWQPWADVDNGWISAEHCHRQMLGDRPPYVSNSTEAFRLAGQIDGVYYGTTRPARRPRDMIEGEQVYIMGYPGGSDDPSLRRGTVYIKRTFSVSDHYEQPTVIVIIPTQKEYTSGVAYEPVIGGMSGGIVTGLSFEPLAILVTQNGQTDLTGDGIPDSSSEVVPLNEVWELIDG